MTVYYHRTNHAESILRDGFTDSSGSYGLATLTLTGVWISNVPLDANEGADGHTLLSLEPIGDVDLSYYELIEDLKPYREWCVPAAMLNTRFRIRSVEHDDGFSV